MTAPSLKRFKKSDYPGSPAWFDALFGPLNSLIDNFQSLGTRLVAFRTLELSTAATLTDSFPVTVAHGLSTPPVSVQVADIKDLDDSRILFTSAVFPTWELSSDGSQVVLRFLAGLTASRRYRVLLRMETDA